MENYAGIDVAMRSKDAAFIKTSNQKSNPNTKILDKVFLFQQFNKGITELRMNNFLAVFLFSDNSDF